MGTESLTNPKRASVPTIPLTELNVLRNSLPEQNRPAPTRVSVLSSGTQQPSPGAPGSPVLVQNGSGVAAQSVGASSLSLAWGVRKQLMRQQHPYNPGWDGIQCQVGGKNTPPGVQCLFIQTRIRPWFSLCALPPSMLCLPLCSAFAPVPKTRYLHRSR